MRTIPQVGSSPASTVHDLSKRKLFAGQARLLAQRADRNLPIVDASVENLVRVYRDLVIEEVAANS